MCPSFVKSIFGRTSNLGLFVVSSRRVRAKNKAEHLEAGGLNFATFDRTWDCLVRFCPKDRPSFTKNVAFHFFSRHLVCASKNVGAVRKCVNLVDLETCCTTGICVSARLMGFGSGVYAAHAPRAHIFPKNDERRNLYHCWY